MKKIILSLLGAAFIMIAVNSCKKPFNGENEKSDGSKTTVHGLGLVLDKDAYNKAERANLDEIKARLIAAGFLSKNQVHSGNLPTSIILNHLTPGDQGLSGTCVSWTIGYAMMGVINNEFSMPNISNPRSPWYIYHKFKYDNNYCVDDGMTFDDAFTVAKGNGVPGYSYDNSFTYACVNPSASANADAETNKLFQAYKVYTLNEIKTSLSVHLPVAWGISVPTSFDDAFANGTTLTSYYGTSRGYHAVAIIGYDDNKNAFLVQNSWGTSAGDPTLPGCMWIDYGMLSNTNFSKETWLITPTTWTQIDGDATDISIGANGTMAIVGTDYNGSLGGSSLYQRVSNSWSAISPGRAIAIAVGPTGTPWVVNSSYNIFVRSGSSWTQLPGYARDIAIGADGSVYIVGTNSAYGGYAIYKWTGSSWSQITGGGVAIAVGADGNPWLVNSSNSIFHMESGSWVQKPGTGTDIGVGADGTVWLVGTNIISTGGGYGLYKWQSNDWAYVSGAAVKITGDANGKAWAVNSSNKIFQIFY